MTRGIGADDVHLRVESSADLEWWGDADSAFDLVLRPGLADHHVLHDQTLGFFRRNQSEVEHWIQEHAGGGAVGLGFGEAFEQLARGRWVGSELNGRQ